MQIFNTYFHTCQLFPTKNRKVQFKKIPEDLMGKKKKENFIKMNFSIKNVTFLIVIFFLSNESLFYNIYSIKQLKKQTFLKARNIRINE